ncbi:hypothetical protein [Chitinophaga rhizosphaerae]|uniref:hypothetical protein n=1 Tax=Chitinophaga rhizosphaerae TaxID=1864947 RepID=UPI0013DED26C|nr:hypothetical protein [Chitinophaga rhizosphaerae]
MIYAELPRAHARPARWALTSAIISWIVTFVLLIAALPIVRQLLASLLMQLYWMFLG